MGVRKIHTIQEMPIELMESTFGKSGGLIWRKAHGIDNSPVEAYSERKSISTERTFDKDTIDIQKLRSILTAMTENLAFQLRRGNKLTSCVTIKLRYSDFQTETLQRKIHYTSADHELIPLALELFDRMYTRRVLIRLIGVKFSHLVNGNFQISLFEDSHKYADLYLAMDKIRNRFGDRSVMRASGMGAKTISRFNPFNGEPPPLLANRRI
jgi:DNA polymerase IV